MRERMQRGFSSFAVTAALCVGVLVLSIIYTTMPRTSNNPRTLITETSLQDQIDPDMIVTDPKSNATSSISGLSPLGDAVLNRIVNAFSSPSGQNATSSDATSTAEQIARALMPVINARAYVAHDLKTTSDTSLARILTYRSDLRDSLAPLLSIPEPEYVTFSRYIQSHNASNLVALEHDADLYRSAASSTLHVIVPQDAVSYHIGILNAMEGFAAKLDALASHAKDPFASAALLKSYNEGEQEILISFNSLAQYYRTKANAGGIATTTHS